MPKLAIADTSEVDRPDKPSPLKRTYVNYVFPEKTLLFLTVFLSICQALLNLAGPLVWQVVVDEAVDNMEWSERMTNFCIFQVAMIFGSHTLSAVRARILEGISQRLTKNIRIDVYKKLQAQSVAWYYHQKTGDLHSRVISDG